jgi:hypothetical protein
MDFLILDLGQSDYMIFIFCKQSPPFMEDRIL